MTPTNRWNDPPCDAEEAVARARGVEGKGGQYILGTGDYRPTAKTDDPFTMKGGKWGTDCAGFALCYAWKLKRHRPGFNRGRWATVSDDINTDSALEDATHNQDLFTLVKPEDARPGDALVYSSVRRDGRRIRIGHVGLIEEVPYYWTPGDWGALTIIQSHGPNGRKPAVVRTSGAIWAKNDLLWTKHKSVIIRPKERL